MKWYRGVMVLRLLGEKKATDYLKLFKAAKDLICVSDAYLKYANPHTRQKIIDSNFA